MKARPSVGENSSKNHGLLETIRESAGKITMRRVWLLLIFLVLPFGSVSAGWGITGETDDEGGMFPSIHSSKQGLEEPDTTITLSRHSVPENTPDSVRVGVLRMGRGGMDVSMPFFLVDYRQERFEIVRDSILIVPDAGKIDFEEQRIHQVVVGILTAGGDTLQRDFTIRVLDTNDPPSGLQLDSSTVGENQTERTHVGTFSIMDQDSADQHKIRLIDSADGRFMLSGRKLFTTDGAQFNHELESRVDIKVKVVDDRGGELTERVTIRIEDRNDPPENIKLKPQAIAENAKPGTLIGKFIVSDEDSADHHSFELSGRGAELLNVRDSLLYVDEGAQLDHESRPVINFEIRVEDSAGAEYKEELQVTVLDVNEPLAVYTEPRLLMEEDETRFFYVRIEDPEFPDSDLRITYRSDNPGLIPRRNIKVDKRGIRRRLRITPRPDSNGVARIMIKADDGEFVDSASFEVNVKPVNDAPYLVRNIKRRLDEGARLLIDQRTLRVRDVDNSPAELQYNVRSLPRNGRIIINGREQRHFTQKDLNKQQVWYQHDGSEHHKDSVQFSVQDPKGARVSTFTLPFDIVPINDPPVISHIEDQYILEDHTTKDLSFTIGDPETAGINLRVEGHSSDEDLIPDKNISITGFDRYRAVKVTPSADANGKAKITLAVHDGLDTTKTSFEVKVEPVNDQPEITAPDKVVFKEDQTAGPMKIRFYDVETTTADLTWDIVSTNEQLITQEGIQLDGSGVEKQLYLTPREDQYGSGSIVMRLSDGELTDTVRTFVRVKSVNDPPHQFSLFNSNVKKSVDSVKVELRWEQTQDPEEKNVKYQVRIEGGELDTTINDLHSPRYTFRAMEKLKPNAEYRWTVKATDGKDTTAASETKQFLTPNFEPVPDEFRLYSNYPNPFNPVTNIRYKIPVKAKVRVSVYDMSGRMVSQLVDEVQSSGEYKVTWNAGDRASGIYVCRVVANGINGDKRFVETRKMMLVK